MKDSSKTNQELIAEISVLKKRIQKLENSDAERKLAEEASKENENKYRLLAENVNDVIFVLDMNLNYTYVSPSIKILRGYEPAEVLKQPSILTLTPSSWDLAMRNLSEIMALEKSEHREILISRTLQLEMIRKDGTIVWTEVKFSFIRDENQRPVGILGVTRDITDRKWTEEALLQSEEKFSKAFQTSPYAITITRPEDGKFVEVNDAFISITGFTREEALASSSIGLKQWVNEDDRQRVVADLKAGRSVVGQEFQFRTKSGNVFTGLFSAQTIQLHHGPCILSSISDITERKEANRKLQEAVIFQQQLIDALPVPVFYKDSEGRYLGCNSSFEKFFGQKREQVTGKSVYELSPKEFADIYHKKDLALLQNPGMQIYESTVKDTGGVIHNVIFHKATFPNRDGSVGGLIGGILDITARKLAEEALRNSEVRLRTLVQTIPDIIWLKDKDGVYLSCNTMFERFFGAREADIVGKTDYDFVDRELANIFREHDLKTMATGKSSDKEDWITFADDGHRALMDAIKTPMYDAQGTLIGVLGIGRDITARKLAEEALRESESSMRAITDSAQDAILMMDPEGRISYWNPAADRILGYTSAEAIGQKLHALIAPSRYHEAYHAAFPVFQQKGQGAAVGKTLDLEARRKDGKEISVQLSLSAIHVKSAWHAVGILRDITERKRAEEELRDSENRLHTLVQTIPDLIWLKDKDGVYRSCNTIFERFFGAKEADIIGKTDYDFVNRELANSFREHDNKAMAAGKTTSNEEWITFADDGHRVFLDTIKTPMYDARGTLNGVLGIGRDITNRRSVDRIRKALGATIQAIAVTVEERDPYTAGHQRRVADLARSIATEMNLPIDIIDGIRMAAAIHDLGKISVPAEILSKPTKLKKTEFDLIKDHSQSGYDILKDIDFPWPIARIVLEHHERMNGSGYPNGLTGDNLLLESRILSVADVVESMASHRPYRPSLGIEAALEEIEKNKGTIYDNTVADACLRLFREKGFKLAVT